MHAAILFRIAAFASPILQSTAAPGDIDIGFGTGGAYLSESPGIALGAALQTDGRVLLAGHRGEANFTLLRLNADGSPDTGFGTSGVFQHSFGIFEAAIGAAQQSSGRIVIGGAGLINGGNRDFTVVGCLANGTLDTSFGTGGTTTTDISDGYNDHVYAMFRHTDDTILLGGYYRDDFAMVRYLPNGALDPGFGAGGKVFTPGSAAADKEIHALAVMSDGRIVAAGQSTGSNNLDVVVARYLSNGTPDTFGTAGRTYTAVGAGNTSDVANCVAVLPDGKVLVGGTSGGDFMILRYTSGGVLDTGFDTDGIVTIGFPGATQKGTGLVVQSDGRIIITGTVTANARNYFAAVRFTADGALDATFGTGGGIATAITAGTDNAYAALLQPDGKLILAGSGGLASQSMAALRYETGGVQTLAQWRMAYFGTSDNAGNAANDFDADRDGLVNLLEYAFGQHPLAGSSRTVPEAMVSGGNLVSTFTSPSTVTGITYAAEWSTSLTTESWQPVGNTGSGSVHTFSVPMSGRSKLYLRWRITAP